MAGVHTYNHGGMRVTVFAIDHSVGHGGRNLRDDVQLIQFLINRYIDDWEETYIKYRGDPRYDARVLDKAGHTIDKLVVDGICGPLTLAAIIATQVSINKWRGCLIDGRIDAIEEGGVSQFAIAKMERVVMGVKDGEVVRAWLPVGKNYFNAMYALAVNARAYPIRPEWDYLSVPEPLRTALVRSMSRYFGGWGRPRQPA